jgi:hypothetical protein
MTLYFSSLLNPLPLTPELKMVLTNALEGVHVTDGRVQRLRLLGGNALELARREDEGGHGVRQTLNGVHLEVHPARHHGAPVVHTR